MTTTETETNTEDQWTPKRVAKAVAKFVVKRSVQATVVTLVYQNTEKFNRIQKIQLYIGACYMGAMLADAAWTRGEEQFDAIAEKIPQIAAYLSEKQESVKEELKESPLSEELKNWD